MKIGHAENVTSILFRHKSYDMKFGAVLPARYMEEAQIKPSERIEFVFDDLYEVDMLLQMLERFMGECSSIRGIWHRE